MTYFLPEKTLGDKLLKFFGKKRGVLLPRDVGDLECYGIVRMRKESFWTALTRKSRDPFPEGVVDIDSSNLFSCREED